jgi:2'-5' RNA ligase
MHRLFVALRPPPAIRRQLAAIMAGVPHARWQDDEQLHLTLRFIGEVDRPLGEDIAAALAGVHAAAPVLALAGVGAFDRQGRTDAIWAGVTPHDALTHLHRKVDHALVRAGLPPERRAYLPHITIARLPRSAGAESEVARFLADHAALTSERFDCAHVMLFESRLGRDGARYEAIGRWPLDPAPQDH